MSIQVVPMTNLMLSIGAAKLRGPFYVNLCIAISNAICIYTATNVQVSTSNVGIAGPAGVGQGFPSNSIPKILERELRTSFDDYDLLGENSSDLIQAISVAVAQTLSVSTHLTPTVGIATGADVPVQGNLNHAGAKTLTGLLTSQMVAVGLLGERTTDLSAAIAEGYTKFLDQVLVVHVIAGAPYPVPANVPVAGIPGMGFVLM
jgi:hypothetical protein